MSDVTWDESDWDNLLSDIKKNRVIPVVGEELYTLSNPGGGETPLYYAAAQRLAKLLKVELPPDSEMGRPLNEVVCAYLRKEKARGGTPEEERVCELFCEAVSGLDLQPSAALQNIAAITDFKLLVTTTPDDLLERALNEKRFGGKRRTTVMSFQLDKKDIGKRDLPSTYERGHTSPDQTPVVFHLFGSLVNERVDQFVISDDDLLEFFHALQQLKDDELRNLRETLKDHHLLFLGGSMSDWLARFLLRTISGSRLSKKRYYDVVTTAGIHRESELLKFLKFFSPRTKLAPYSASEFVDELHRRWRESQPQESKPAPPLPRPEPLAAAPDELRSPQPPAISAPPQPEPPGEMPEGAVFISYASEDREAVRKLKAHLGDAGITVWFDRDRLRAGENWDWKIQRNLKACSFFMPVISRNTQNAQLDVYFRSEWNQADQIVSRSHHAIEFVLPILLEPMREELQVPISFMRAQRTVAPSGVPPKAFVEWVRELTEHRKLNPLRRPASR